MFQRFFIHINYVSEIPYSAVLTKVDTICPATNEDIRVVFRSKAVAKVAQTLHEILNLDKKYMLPVQVQISHHFRNQLITFFWSMKSTLIDPHCFESYMYCTKKFRMHIFIWLIDFFFFRYKHLLLHCSYIKKKI